MNPLVIDAVQTELEAAVVDFASFLPAFVVALVILAVGRYVGAALEPVVRRIGQRSHADEKIAETPLGVLFPDRPGAVSETLGVLVKYYVLLLAAFAAVDYLGFQVVTEWFEGAIGYVPALAGGLLILALGFFVADYAVSAVRNSEVIADTAYEAHAAATTRTLLYFVVLVIGLDTMGVNVGLLYAFADTFALAIGIALALAVGIALGLGGKEYVAENIDDWAPGSDSARKTAEPTATDD